MKKILLVDDQQDQLVTMVNYIEQMGSDYCLLTASSGEIGYEIARKEIPDLIITDWDMPGMNGIEFIQSVKKNLDTSEVHIIMATGVMMKPEDLKLALETGATDYIRKPIDGVELLARMNSVLQLADSFKVLKQQKDIERKHLQEKLSNELTINELQKEKIKQKDKELLLFTTCLSSKTEVLQSVKGKLQELSSITTPEIREKINELISEINSNLNQENTWQKFKTYFDQVHEGFFKKLLDSYPQLTQYDWKLCALIRMNLSTKEIAQLLNITIDSAETSRIRLRKKLQLVSEINLSRFIHSI